jgi:Recombinase
LACGLELLDSQYQGTSAVYEWQCRQFGHIVKRSKGNIQQSLTKGLPACSIGGPGISANVLSRKAIADKFAAEVLPIIETLKGEGHTSLEALARQLNEQKVPTPRGTRWYASSVRNLMSRVYKG